MYSCCQTIILHFDIIIIAFILHGDSDNDDGDATIINAIIVGGVFNGYVNGLTLMHNL